MAAGRKHHATNCIILSCKERILLELVQDDMDLLYEMT